MLPPASIHSLRLALLLTCSYMTGCGHVWRRSKWLGSLLPRWRQLCIPGWAWRWFGIAPAVAADPRRYREMVRASPALDRDVSPQRGVGGAGPGAGVVPRDSAELWRQRGDETRPNLDRMTAAMAAFERAMELNAADPPGPERPLGARDWAWQGRCQCCASSGATQRPGAGRTWRSDVSKGVVSWYELGIVQLAEEIKRQR